MHVETKTLIPAIRSALESVRYGCRDIKVVPTETADLSAYAGDGQRGFAILVNLETGERKRFTGSWGGSNMFVRTAVDDSSGVGALPPNGAVIKGSMGYPRTFATLYVHPAAMGRFLPSGEEETLSETEQQVIYCFAAIKGGQYRRDELARRVGHPSVSDPIIDSLISRGYLKRAKNGATAITTKGKNARTIRY